MQKVKYSTRVSEYCSLAYLTRGLGILFAIIPDMGLGILFPTIPDMGLEIVFTAIPGMGLAMLFIASMHGHTKIFLDGLPLV